MTDAPDRGDLGPGEFHPVVGVDPHPLPWPTEAHFDPELLELGDRRNVVDKYRYWSVEAIVADLDTSRAKLHIAIENWQHDLNIGSVVRTANALRISNHTQASYYLEVTFKGTNDTGENIFIPDTYFICGELGAKDNNNMPDKLMVCPAYGLDFFYVYEYTGETAGTEW